jgi:hypothetical protein
VKENKAVEWLTPWHVAISFSGALDASYSVILRINTARD